jgi:hypothetical protein
VIERPSAAPAFAPESSIRMTALLPSVAVLGLEAGCVYPSMTTESMTGGSAAAGAIVWRPDPGIAKAIVSWPGLPFASRMACRRLPAPESDVVVTVNVAAAARPAASVAATQRSVLAGRAAARRTSQTVRNVGVVIPHYIAPAAGTRRDARHIWHERFNAARLLPR